MNEEELENLCLDWFREGGWCELGDEILKKIAIKITDKLRKSTTVD